MRSQPLSRALLLLAVFTIGASAAEQFRTDLNPALLYHQAFLLTPELSSEDRNYLFTTAYDRRNQPLDERAAKLLAGYDNSFKLFRRAIHARVPCDWGIDLSDGPGAMLPGLARAKLATQAACLRARHALQEGREDDAKDDLVAAFVLGRNLSKDTILISALVQIAIENIITSFVAENFHRFSPKTLRQIVAGYDSAPARGLIQQCVSTERYGFCDWFIRQVEASRAEHPGDQAAALNRIRELSEAVFTEGNPDREFAEKLIAAAGGTPEGVVNYARQLYPLYDELAEVMSLPYAEYSQRITGFANKIKKHPNLLVGQFFPALEKCRGKEFNSLVREAMLRAAVEYRLHGEPGLEKVIDPCGDGPFAFRRVTHNGVDRGFELKSKLNWRGFDEVLIFVETAGPSFRLEGPNAGK